MVPDSRELEELKKTFDLESYRPVPVTWHLRQALLTGLRKKQDVLPDIDGREETKSDLIRAILSGSSPYLISEEGTGKTRLARSVARLLPTVPAIKGCPYHDDPKWDRSLLCDRCREAMDPVAKFGLEFIPGEMRFSRIQGNEYTNEAKLLGLKDIQAIAAGASPADPKAFIGTGIFRANRGILMIDELPAIRTKVQVLLHPLLEEKKAVLEEYNWERFVDLMLIATGNPIGFSHVNDIPRPLVDRLELIFMELPEEGVEKEIMLKERSLLKGDGFPRNNGRHLAPRDPYVDPVLCERNTVVPWWVVEVLNRTVRYTRECPNLEKKSSIRGGGRAFEHTISSCEMEGRSVATLKDAFLGLRLALRGRIGLTPNFLDFDNPQNTIRKTDRVVEDMLRDILMEVSQEVLKEVSLSREAFVKELISLHMEGMKDRHLQRFPETEKIVNHMRDFWPHKIPRTYCSDFEKQLFDGSGDVETSVAVEYNQSAVDFVASGLAAKGVIRQEPLLEALFVPRKAAL